ncbi:transposase, partial [Streptomyces sp. NPDC056796]|uniref:transposase n=1 Tax=Streptomyces sp. NPDC056796 TaxID=3345947 RepID=UPI0036B82914
LGDKGYSSRGIRNYLRKRGIAHTIPERSDQQERYKQRNVVERCFNALKQYRAIATRYDKNRESCEAALTIASLLMWI